MTQQTSPTRTGTTFAPQKILLRFALRASRFALRASRFALRKPQAASQILLWRRTLFCLCCSLLLAFSSKAQGPYYLKAHWDFTNAFAMANDISGNGHNGTVIGCTPVPGCAGLPNTALRFRPGNWVQVPGSTAGAVGDQQKFIKQ